MIEDDVPHIQAECSACHFVFDMKFGADCPACEHTGVAWARRITIEEYNRERAAKPSYFRRQDLEYNTKRLPQRQYYYYNNFTREEHTLTEGEKLDIAELDKMYALVDPRR
jgi:hypothetical protein